jgi:hypothetical protein
MARRRVAGPKPRVLVVSSVELAESVVRSLVGDEAETIVVVPAVRQSRLQWLANDDDRARETAERAAARMAERTPGETIEARAGDPDPRLAVEDAVREFGADQILVVTRPEESAGWLEEQAAGVGPEFAGIPVRRVELEGPGAGA